MIYGLDVNVGAIIKMMTSSSCLNKGDRWGTKLAGVPVTGSLIRLVCVQGFSF